MTKAALKENVQGLIVKVRTKDALAQIKDFIEHSRQDYSQLENAVLMQMASLSSANQQKMNGLVTDDDFNRLIAKVNYATLNIVDQVDEDDEVDNNSGKNKKIKILFLSANPENTPQLNLDAEIEHVKKGFKTASLANKFEFISEAAVTLPDIIKAMMKYKPQIVHFAGHGTEKDGLIIDDGNGQSVYFTTDSISRLFKLFKNQVECTLLNACYSEEQAIAISKEGVMSENKNQGIYAVGMNDVVGDKAAIDFSVGFYQAIGEGYDYKFAFEMGLVNVNAVTATDKPEIWFNGKNITDKK